MMTSPRQPGAINREAAPTEKQIDYLMVLVEGRDIGMGTEEFKAMFHLLRESGVVDRGWVSDTIEEYKSMPPRGRSGPEPGYYVHDDEMYVVVRTKDGKRTYAKQLTKNPDTGRWSWEYAPGAGRKMAHMTPMSVDEAAKFGHLHGVCAICCRPLNDPKSVKAGIGPVCQKKLVRK